MLLDRETISNAASKYSLHALVSSILVPLVLFAVLVELGFDPYQLPIVGFLFWALLAIAVLGALVSVWRIARSESGFSLRASRPFAVLLSGIVIGGGLVTAKRTAAYNPERNEPTAVEPSTEDYSDGHCLLRLVGKNEPKKYREGGNAGSIGWYLLVANYYEWTVELAINTTENTVTAIAKASGRSSPFYGFQINYHRADSIATGAIVCLWDATQKSCKANLIPDKKSMSRDFVSSAANVDGKSEGAQANVAAEAAVSVNGEPAIDEISVGIEKVLATKIRIPAGVKRAQPINAYYLFQCVTR
jgi:hypothetical protein